MPTDSELSQPLRLALIDPAGDAAPRIRFGPDPSMVKRGDQKITLLSELEGRIGAGAGTSALGHSIETAYSSMLKAWEKEDKGDAPSEYKIFGTGDTVELSKRRRTQLLTTALGGQLQELLGSAQGRVEELKKSGIDGEDHSEKLLEVNDSMRSLMFASKLARVTDYCQKTSQALEKSVPIHRFLSGFEHEARNVDFLRTLREEITRYASILSEIAPKDTITYLTRYKARGVTEDFLEANRTIFEETDRLLNSHSTVMPAIASNLDAFASELRAKKGNPKDAVHVIASALSQLESAEELADAFTDMRQFKSDTLRNHLMSTTSSAAERTKSEAIGKSQAGPKNSSQTTNGGLKDFGPVHYALVKDDAGLENTILRILSQPYTDDTIYGHLPKDGTESSSSK